MTKEIEIVQDFEGSRFNIGDRGVTTGYVKSKNEGSKVMVLINGIADAVPIYCVKPVNQNK